MLPPALPFWFALGVLIACLNSPFPSIAVRWYIAGLSLIALPLLATLAHAWTTILLGSLLALIASYVVAVIVNIIRAVF